MEQFEILVHCDTARAVVPLEAGPEWAGEEAEPPPASPSAAQGKCCQAAILETHLQ